MAKVNRETEIELDSGKLVIVQVEVEGDYDAHFGRKDADGKRGVGVWSIIDHTYDIDSEDELTDDEESELASKVEDYVYDTEWDFDSASDDDDDDDEGMF